VTSCDKLRGEARISWIRKLLNWTSWHSVPFLNEEREPPELKHLSRERKRNQSRFR